MDKLKKLENVKLMKELDFIESEFNYKNEVICEADSNFLKTVNAYLEIHPELKKIFDDKVNKKIEEMLVRKKNEELENDPGVEDDTIDQIGGEDDNEEQEKTKDIIEEKENKLDFKNEKIKRLYREVAKLTHPDKIKNKKLNNLYLKATSYYDENNIFGIYTICDELEIGFEIEPEDKFFLSQRIDSLKQRIKFLESTYTWKWQHTEDFKERETIILRYVSSQIS